MKAQSFEDLTVYQQARELTNRIYEITRNAGFARDFRLVDQIRGASVSIMSNIAEGFERGTNGEFVQFLYIGKGSSAEVRAQLTVALDQRYISGADFGELTNRCRRLSGMLNNLIAYLRQTRSNNRRTLGPGETLVTAESNRIRKENKKN